MYHSAAEQCWESSARPALAWPSRQPPLTSSNWRSCPSDSAVGQPLHGVAIGNDWSVNTSYVEINGADDPSRVVSKAVDGWAVLHPVLHTDLDCADLGIEIRVNEDVVAFGRTSQMVNDPRYLIHYLSFYVTLTPGDLIFTGTVAPPVQPGHHRDVADSDVVEVEIEKIGVLRNVVRFSSQTFTAAHASEGW